MVDRRKFINFVSLNSFRESFINPIIENGIEAHVIIGNHDVPYRNSNRINSMSELFGPMYMDKRFFYYPEANEVKLEDDTLIAVLPWINNSNYKESLDFINNTKAQILFGHLELNGFEMYRGMKSEGGMNASVFQKFDVVCSGHFHHKSSRGNINYLGNPYEITWNDYNDNRGFHIFDTETRNLEFIQNPYKMFHKLHYDDEGKKFEDISKINFEEFKNTYVKVVVRNKTNPYWFDIVMDNLYKANPANVVIVDDNKNMDSLSEEDIVNEAEDTMTILNSYIKNLDTNVNKNELSRLFMNLYNDAQNIEV